MCRSTKCFFRSSFVVNLRELVINDQAQSQQAQQTRQQTRRQTRHRNKKEIPPCQTRSFVARVAKRRRVVVCCLLFVVNASLSFFFLYGGASLSVFDVAVGPCRRERGLVDERSYAIDLESSRRSTSSIWRVRSELDEREVDRRRLGLNSRSLSQSYNYGLSQSYNYVAVDLGVIS